MFLTELTKSITYFYYLVRRCNFFTNSLWFPKENSDHFETMEVICDLSDKTALTAYYCTVFYLVHMLFGVTGISGAFSWACAVCDRLAGRSRTARRATGSDHRQNASPSHHKTPVNSPYDILH